MAVTSPDLVRELTDKAIEEFEERIGSIVGLKIPRNFHNTVKAVDVAYADLIADTEKCIIAMHIAEDKAARQEAANSAKRVDSAITSMFSNKKLWKAIMALETKNLTESSLALLDRIKMEMKRAGAHLAAVPQESLAKIRRRITGLENEFMQNIAAAKTTLYFSRGELAGLPRQFFVGRPIKNGKYAVSLKYTDYFAVMSHAHDPKVRQKLSKHFRTRAHPKNAEILAKLLRLRREEANILGFKDFIELAVQNCEAESEEQIRKFLAFIRRALEKPAKEHLDWLRRFKMAFSREQKIAAQPIKEWDIAYFGRKMAIELYSIDMHERIFDISRAVSVIMDKLAQLFGLRIESTGAKVWHNSVEAYIAYSAATDRYIGRFYLDLFPRDGKYNHYMTVQLRKGHKNMEGHWVHPIATIIGNFGRKINHFELRTLFHEFGHVFHELCSKTPHFMLAGTSTQRDFMEAPSQLMENWAFDQDILAALGVGVTMAQKIKKAKYVGRAHEFLGIVAMALFDLDAHEMDAPTPKKLADLWREKMRKVALINVSDDVNGAASFEHIASDYAARYYGYLWSRAYSDDMFGKFSSIYDLKTGLNFREEIMAIGGEVGPETAFKNFMGRGMELCALIGEIGGIAV